MLSHDGLDDAGRRVDLPDIAGAIIGEIEIALAVQGQAPYVVEWGLRCRTAIA